MSSPLDPAKLKVVELRAELSKRGLDQKGNKPALVKRLKDALEEELTEEIPDTSIADTSTEDLDSSQHSQEETAPPEAPSECKLLETTADLAQSMSPKSTEVEIDPSEEIALQELEPTPAEEPEEAQPTPMESEDVEPVPEPEPEVPLAPEEELPASQAESNNEAKSEEKLENGDQEEPKSRKSRWGDESENTEGGETEPSVEGSKKDEAEGEEKMEDDADSKGEKRKRTSPSPDRSQRRRSKSPIKEDEPPIDNEKVQLNWYDSDLHLQLDKESFLSAKPYHEGAFGFAWAGVRATHGVNAGKVCFEVKITEELKWEDFSKYYEKSSRRDDHHRRSESSRRSHDRSRSEDESKKEETNQKAENGDNPAQKTEERDKDESPDTKAEEKSSEAEEKSTEIEEKSTESEEKSTEAEEKPAEDVEKPAEELEKPAEDVEKPSEVAEEEKPMEVDEKTTEVAEKPEEDVKAEEPKAQDEEPTEEKPQEEEEPSEPIPSHLFRVGWSLIKTGLQLGEDENSYGYESSGKFVSNKEFIEYGVTFGVNDVIASYIDLDGEEITINYAVNGETQSEATRIPKVDLPENFAFFPHVLSRNYAFELNLGSKEPWFAQPQEFTDFQFLEQVEEKISGPVRPETRSDCEVILMCGLPASGKTHWVREYVESNPDKKYTLLGNTQLLEKMTVSGDALKNKFKGRWNVLLDRLQKCLNKLVEIAALRRRNYIIDQPNVFPSAQRRKLRPFEGFKRRAVVVVVGDEEQAKRQSLQEAQGGKDVPDSSVLEMKANMSLPQKGDWVDEVVYAGGVEESEAKSIIQKYNQQGRDAGYGVQKRFGGGYRDDRNRWQNRRNDYHRGGNYRDNRYHNNRYDRGPPRQNWHPQRPGGWNNNRDRRDNRGPPMGGGGGGGGGNRDWRNNRGNQREHRGSRELQGNNYNRNRNAPRPGGGWQSSGGWNQGGGGGGGWNNQAWNQSAWGNQGGWSQSQSQNQWKYGGGGGGGNQNYGGYGSNWNYYGQYPQNWNAQGQASTGGATAGAAQYGGYSQQEWAQYAQQYAQQGQTTTTSAIAPSTPQK